MRHGQSRSRLRFSIALGLSLIGALVNVACGGNEEVTLFIVSHNVPGSDTEFQVVGAGVNTARTELPTSNMHIGASSGFNYHARLLLPEAQAEQQLSITVFAQEDPGVLTLCHLHHTIDEGDVWIEILGSTVTCLFHTEEYEATQP